MVTKTFNRYIWLLNLLLQHKQLTFEQISRLWQESSLGDGKPMPIRTFHVHKDAIEEIFGVKIVCNPSRKYAYSIDSTETLRTDRTRQWLLRSFTLSNMITAGHNMADRILFEDIPHGTEYLQTVIEAMQKNQELVVDYQSFNGWHHEVLHMQAYAMKVYNRRWYVMGLIKEKDGIRNLALDRVIDMSATDVKYEVPRSFNAEKYYANTIGVYVNEELKPQKVRIRVYGDQIEYIRSLPLHKSQREGNSRLGEFAEFEYRLCLTPELYTYLLAMGEKVEVLEPQELRDKMKARLQEALCRYKE